MSAPAIRTAAHLNAPSSSANATQTYYTAIGTHPHDARLYDDQAEEKIRTLIQTGERVIAWGEIGLDFHYDNSPRDVQVAVFKRQLRAARDLNLPVIIHTREAEAETIEILKTDYDGADRRGVFHCFSGTQSSPNRRSISVL